MSEFTKGEWKIQRVNSPYIIWRVTDSSRYNSVATGIYKEADARLIAAAPELYEIVKDFCDEVETFVSIYDKFPEEFTNIAEQAQEILERTNSEEDEDDWLTGKACVVGRTDDDDDDDGCVYSDLFVLFCVFCVCVWLNDDEDDEEEEEEDGGSGGWEGGGLENEGAGIEG